MKKFNLFSEPWILVLTPAGNTLEISLKDLLLNCHNYVSFAGENKHQDVAITRLAAALIVTVLYKYDITGAYNFITTKEEALDRFKYVWNNGIPECTINAYEKEWYDKFYLIDEEFPFFQIEKGVFQKKQKKGSLDEYIYEVVGKKGLCATNEFSVKSIMGTVLESGNSKSPFAPYSNTDELTLSYSEAARWLVWYMSFAGCASKSPGNFNSKMTWASGGALLVPQGKTLKETLLLNSVMYYNNTPYSNIAPVWERKTTSGCEFAPYGEIGHPDNLPELYTQQSRKIKLHTKGDRIDGLFIVPGDYWNKNDARIEPMFLWTKTKDNDILAPKHHHFSAPAWKEYTSVIPIDKSITPGCIVWINTLYKNKILDEEQNIPYQIVDITYGSMNSSIDKLIETSFSINRIFFNEKISDKMYECIKQINEISSIIYKFGLEVAKSCGADDRTAKPSASRLSQNYEEKISPQIFKCLNNKISIEELNKIIFQYADELTESQLSNLPLSAFKGHATYNVGKAENIFRYSLKKIKNIE